MKVFSKMKVVTKDGLFKCRTLKTTEMQNESLIDVQPVKGLKKRSYVTRPSHTADKTQTRIL